MLNHTRRIVEIIRCWVALAVLDRQTQRIWFDYESVFKKRPPPSEDAIPFASLSAIWYWMSEHSLTVTHRPNRADMRHRQRRQRCCLQYTHSARSVFGFVWCDRVRVRSVSLAPLCHCVPMALLRSFTCELCMCTRHWTALAARWCWFYICACIRVAG